ncbi:bifunctional sulfate adenylyltransferase subunit 1/adenylylsulfate kinase [Bradyrhizobium sp. DOA9]|uniref:bifunctional sulfate adenylyltransferase subunit 1/adenylylsulfate kinase n=1 Tax=Bradyrhizobium sp. DOA9 TaxID=1126627 RepID=UPI000A6B7890|nr:bifunctional sulfate adenylyltransferase subunit 1/adenylylsulfate kinase [Bradyrhizobium sp. DOA9]
MRLDGKDQLRFITCGSVDDGKSTLIGRLLHDSSSIRDDELKALARDSLKYGTTGEEIDFALVVDGLEAERQQAITIDVAYRYFSTGRRSFMVADTPGHEQYTRNMATAASNAQLAVILIDASKGVLVQTKRHSLICSLLGVRHVVLAVNKMDLVGYGKESFDRAVADYRAFASALGFLSIAAIPISARYGDNVTGRSEATGWYKGPCLLHHLESINAQPNTADQPFRFAVQWVNRPSRAFRGYAGAVVSGSIEVGGEIVVARSGRSSRVEKIVTYDGELARAEPGSAVTITLADDIDVGRGDVLADPLNQPEVSDQFAAYVIWMDQQAMAVGRPYAFRIGAQSIASGHIRATRHKIDINTGAQIEAHALSFNEIGLCDIALATPACVDSYKKNRHTGSFIIIDRYTNRTVGAGMIALELRRIGGIGRPPLPLGKSERSALKQQRACIIWLTGEHGKAAIGNLVEQKLFELAHHTMLLEAGNVGIAVGETNRKEDVWRIGQIAKLMVDAGLIVICALPCPTSTSRDHVRALVSAAEFIEVFVDDQNGGCVQHDNCEMHAKAGLPELLKVADASSEPPLRHLEAAGHGPHRLAEIVLGYLVEKGIITR